MMDKDILEKLRNNIRIIFDIEVYPNCFLIGFYNLITKQYTIYEISDRKNNFKEIVNYIHKVGKYAYFIGFNNLRYDWPIVHLLLTKFNERNTAKHINNILYYKSKDIIIHDKYFVVPTNKQLRTQIDLRAINHYNNKARMTSLKQLEFVFRLLNIRDLPYDPNHPLTSEQIDDLIDYLYIDLEATTILYEHTKDAISLRENISFKFRYDFLNMSESDIGENLLLLLYCRKTGANMQMVKNLRTYRKVIDFKDVILDGISYKYEGFNKLYEWFKKQSITKTKGTFSEIPFDNIKDLEGYYTRLPTKSLQKELNISFDNVDYVYGVGGIHAARKNTVFNEKHLLYSSHTLMSADVASLYPFAMVNYKLAPKHLNSEAFLDVFKNDILLVRIREKQKEYNLRDQDIIDIFKIVLNSAYGKLNSAFSWLYDPLQTIKCTVNNQILMTLLSDRLYSEIPDCQLIMLNTDGIEILIPNDKLDVYNKVCSDWEKETDFILEHDEYKKLYVRDCNNYVGKFKNGKIKRKGAYEYDYTSRDLHKNHSKIIVPLIAEKILLQENDEETKTVEDFIYQYLETDIEKFFCMAKVNKKDKLFAEQSDVAELKKDKKNFDPNKYQAVNEIQKLTRYVNVNDDCNQGVYLTKFMLPHPNKPNINRWSRYEASSKSLILNDLTNVDYDYIKSNVNIDYYVNEVNKLLKPFKNE